MKDYGQEGVLVWRNLLDLHTLRYLINESTRLTIQCFALSFDKSRVTSLEQLSVAEFSGE